LTTCGREPGEGAVLPYAARRRAPPPTSRIAGPTIEAIIEDASEMARAVDDGRRWQRVLRHAAGSRLRDGAGEEALRSPA